MVGKFFGFFLNCDWRFNEFFNLVVYVFYVICVEFMVLVVLGKEVGNVFLNVVLKSQFLVLRENIIVWMNVIGLIIIVLLELYWIVFYD